MLDYTIWVVSPPNYPHSKCFNEVALSLKSAFHELGYGCKITKEFPECKERVVILGGHLLHLWDMGGLVNPVIWQLEQIPAIGEGNRLDAPVVGMYFEILRRAEVWDYSARNIEVLAGYGIEAKLLEVGYSPCLTCIENVVSPDIDLLFIGSLNPRREKIINELANRGVNVHVAYDCYGVKRDALIARSKVVLNMHYYESKIFEIVRCSYLMANRKAIVSEDGFSGGDYEDGILFVPYDSLADSCVAVLESVDAREELGRRGFEVLSKRRQVDFLRGVL